MPEFIQVTYMCQACFQIFYEKFDERKHYGSSHGDVDILGSYEKGKVRKRKIEGEDEDKAAHMEEGENGDEDDTGGDDGAGGGLGSEGEALDVMYP
ncbi:hypothetical protein VTL71DRAFT_6549 [Oculimacula yallundae]|uniref:C2H2-type domain-containing protein n=1 Tax=Oculimacula yallundae TaxID=86028 RepID=A0ABR4BXC0_9HELO